MAMSREFVNRPQTATFIPAVNEDDDVGRNNNDADVA